MSYYIIEHPTRGVLMDTSEVGEPRWSWSRPRNDEDVMRSFSPGEARKRLDTYVNSVLRPKCVILRSPGRDEIGWEEVSA